MHPADLGGIVAPAMVALGKEIDRIHLPRAKCLLKLLLRKARSNSGQMLRCMKVQMDLALSDALWPHLHTKSQLNQTHVGTIRMNLTRVNFYKINEIITIIFTILYPIFRVRRQPPTSQKHGRA